MEIMNGVIVSVSKYPECVEFYQTEVGLPLLMQKRGITRFRFGPMYLQVEDAAHSGLPLTAGVILRQHVGDILVVEREMREKGVKLEIHRLEWGDIGFTFDPHGNKLEYFREVDFDSREKQL